MPDSSSLPNGDSIELDSATLERGLRIFKKFCACGHAATALCDWRVKDRTTGTCDTPVCPKHLKQVAPGKVLCPEHQLEYDRCVTPLRAALGDEGLSAARAEGRQLPVEEAIQLALEESGD